MGTHGEDRDAERTSRRQIPGWPVGLASAFLLIGVPLAIVFLNENSRVTETVLQPQAVQLLPNGNDPRTLMVAVTWHKDGWCVGEFQPQATETESEVMLGPVVDRQEPNAPCAGVGSNGRMAWGELTLKAPLGARQVVRSSDGVALPVYTADGQIRH